MNCPQIPKQINASASAWLFSNKISSVRRINGYSSSLWAIFHIVAHMHCHDLGVCIFARVSEISSCFVAFSSRFGSYLRTISSCFKIHSQNHFHRLGVSLAKRFCSNAIFLVQMRSNQFGFSSALTQRAQSLLIERVIANAKLTIR